MTAASPALAAELAALVEGTTVSAGFGQATAEVAPQRWHDAAAVARDELGCARFDWLGAEDAGRPGALGEAHAVLLHVVAPRRRLGLLLRTSVADGAALPSVADLWAGADWPEREAAEMFGLALAGRDEPPRLLLPDSFDGHPLRKDFLLAARAVVPWPGRLEPGQSEPGGSEQGGSEPGRSEPGGSGSGRRRRLVPPGVPAEGWGGL